MKKILIGIACTTLISIHAQTITTGAVPGAPFCPGESFVLAYTITGSYSAGNVFTAQRSNSVGSFASPVVIGSIASTTTGNINCTIAMGTPAGAGYLVRVISSTPSVTGSNTGPFTIDASPTAFATNWGPYCEGGTIQINSIGGSATDDWTGPNSYIQNNLQNPTIPGSTIAMNGSYTVTVTNAASCTATATTTVVVNTLPIPTATNTGPYCVGAIIALSSTGGTTYSWSGPLAYSNATQNPTIVSATTGMGGVYTVTVTNAAGCINTATTTVIVNSLPLDSASNTGPYCAGETIQLNSFGGTDYSWSGPLAFNDTVQNPTIPASTTAMSGNYTVTITNASGCTITSSTTVVVGCVGIEDEEILKVNVYPNPTSDLFTISLNENIIGDSKITLLNLVGQTVYAVTPNQLITMISAESIGLKQGIYLVQIKYKDQNKVVRVIVM